jgi:carboxymethylenebutenolidase
MNGDDVKNRAIALYDRFTHVTHDRRAFMAEMTKLAGSAAAAQALVATIAADPAAAAVIAEDDKRLTAKEVGWKGANGHILKGYMAIPKTGKKRKIAPVLVIHENRGLQPYTRDVARRLAVAGFVGLAIDFLSPQGGTPADEDKARTMIGALDMPATIADGVATVDWLAHHKLLNGKVGVVGFCYGGGISNFLATKVPTLAAAVPFYGAQPPAEEVPNIKAPLLIHYAGTGERINAGWPAYETALKAAGTRYQAFVYAGVQHGFNNDTTPRYDAEAARLAWGRTLEFFKQQLA